MNILPIDSAEHPINQWKVRYGIQKGDIRTPLEQQYDWIE